MGLFVFFKVLRLLKEFIPRPPRPPKVKTGIFISPSLFASAIFGSARSSIFESYDSNFLGDYRLDGVSR